MQNVIQHGVQHILHFWSFLSVLSNLNKFDGVQLDLDTCICVPAQDVETVHGIWKHLKMVSEK